MSKTVSILDLVDMEELAQATPNFHSKPLEILTDSKDTSVPVELTDGQQQADDMLQKFLGEESPDLHYMCITGSAGVGKTYMMFRVMEYIDPFNCIFTAPTNKAVGVLKKMLPAEAEAVTLHRFLGLTVKRVKGKPISVRREDYDPYDWKHIDVVVIDEASMLDDNLMELIDTDARENDRRYIFVGDPCQLPPIEGEGKYSKSFEVADPEYRVFLSEVVRQAKDNPIIQVATSIRHAINAMEEPDITGGVNEETQQGVYLLEPRAFFDKIEELASDPRLFTDLDYMKVVAWKNKTTRKYSRFIRESLGMDVTRPFQEGDTVIVNDAFVRNSIVIAGTGAEVTVARMVSTKHPVYGFPSWEIVLMSKGSMIKSESPLFCVDDTAIDALADKLEDLRDEAIRTHKWRPFYALLEYYIDVRPPYASTAHKAQGSTFENVFVDLNDIYKNRSKTTADKCYYVAITRASSNVYVRM